MRESAYILLIMTVSVDFVHVKNDDFKKNTQENDLSEVKKLNS
jgi:hypothetical protein